MKLAIMLLGLSGLGAGDLTVTIAGLRVTPQPWDKVANLARLDHFAREAAAKGADLVFTPEGFLEGYVANSKVHPEVTREQYFEVGETIEGPSLKRVRELARELRVHVGIGFAERRGMQMFNSFAVFAPSGELVLHYSKVHNDDDEPYNTTGREFPVVKTPLGRWGALICYDRQLPETARILAIKGAQLILVPAWGSSNDMNDAMMRTRAFENSVWVAFVHPKRVLIIDPRGKVVMQDQGDEDQLVMAQIRLDEHPGKGAIRSRKASLYGELVK